MSIERRTTKSGVRYDVRLRSSGGRPYMRTFRTRREAGEFEAREIADRSRGAWLDPRDSDRTVADVADEWLQSNPGKRPGSYARDESVLRVHVVPALGKRRISTVTRRDVQALVNRWAARAKPRTVERQYGVVRAVLGYAADVGFITRSPCRNVNLPEAQPLRRRVLSQNDVERLADALGVDYGPMAYLGAALGLRWGEVAGLRIGRVDVLRSTLSVAEQLTRGTGGRSIFSSPKSHAGKRTLAMPQPLATMLGDHMARRGLTGADLDELVFVSPQGGPLRYDRWRRRVWMPAVRRAGLEGVTFHDLRRTNATALVRDGADLKTAQTRLGHSDPRLTLGLYAQATSEADRAAATLLEHHFFDAPNEPRAMDAR
jgi:integrase